MPSVRAAAFSDPSAGGRDRCVSHLSPSGPVNPYRNESPSGPVCPISHHAVHGGGESVAGGPQQPLLSESALRAGGGPQQAADVRVGGDSRRQPAVAVHHRDRGAVLQQ